MAKPVKRQSAKLQEEILKQIKKRRNILMKRFAQKIIGFLGIVMMIAITSCDRTDLEGEVDAVSVLPPEPIVTYSESDAESGQRIEHGEMIADINETKRLLHEQHHPHGVVETRSVPGDFDPPAMTSIEDFVLSKEDLTVINPGPGEYVHVMEGQRHGYRNLTIGITYTAPDGAPPMHTHEGEESHVLLEGQKVLYALGDDIFVVEGPYIINIPPMVPHSFKNLDDEVAELVVIFPTNVWEYDVLDYFPFNTPEAEALAEEAKRAEMQPE